MVKHAHWTLLAGSNQCYLSGDAVLGPVLYLRACRSQEYAPAVQAPGPGCLHPFHIGQQQRDLALCYSCIHTALGDTMLLSSQGIGQGVSVLLQKLAILLESLNSKNTGRLNMTKLLHVDNTGGGEGGGGPGRAWLV